MNIGPTLVSRVACLGALLALANAPAAGDVILYDNFGPDDAYFGSSGWTLADGDPCPGIAIYQSIATPFVAPATDVKLASVTAAILHSADPGDTCENKVTLVLHADDNGFPGAALESAEATDLPVSIAFERPPTTWTFSGNTTLEAGKTYHIAAYGPNHAWRRNVIGDEDLMFFALAPDEWNTLDSFRPAVRVVGVGQPEAVPYGCGVNPAGSLTAIGTPSTGGSLTVEVHNPLGTQAPGSIALLTANLAADPAFPCGTLLPGFGMAGGGAPGELLVALGGPSADLGAWMGTPVAFDIAIADAPGLVGTSTFLQGAIVDLTPGALAPIGLTEGLELKIDF